MTLSVSSGKSISSSELGPETEPRIVKRKYQNSLRGSLGKMLSRTITLALDSWTYELHVLGTQHSVMVVGLGHTLWTGGWVS